MKKATRKGENMTEPEMTLERAKEIVAKECGGYPCDEFMIHNYAWGIIAGHAAGLKECENKHTVSTCSCEAYKLEIQEGLRIRVLRSLVKELIKNKNP